MLNVTIFNPIIPPPPPAHNRARKGVLEEKSERCSPTDSTVCDQRRESFSFRSGRPAAKRAEQRAPVAADIFPHQSIPHTKTPRNKGVTS
jgi:hypothetical protein